MVSAVSPIALLVVTSVLMVFSGQAKKRLLPKTPTCPVCHRERKRCTCRWL